MSKIALLTIHHTTNFGSTLQTYALYEAVCSLGGDVELLDYRCQEIENREFIRPNWKSIKGMYNYLTMKKINLKKASALNEFLSENMTLSQPYDNGDIEQANDQYDTFLVGSDIVWGLNVTGNDFNYFLEFAHDNKKKIAFGSSAGLHWPEEHKGRIKRLIERFDHVAVRERTVAGWITELTGMRPKVVSDPTLLYTAEQWARLAENPSIEGPYILVYFWDAREKILEDAIRLGKAKNMKVYSIRYGSSRKGIISIRPITVGQFLGLIQNAAYVLSGSYHGLLFSLYFHREVFYYNRANFSRMESLSEWLGIGNHDGMKVQIEAAAPLDFKAIDEKMEDQRRESLDILRNFINQ